MKIRKKDFMQPIEILLELVRAAVLDKQPVIPNNVAIDWDEQLQMASNEDVIGWAWNGICKLPKEQQPLRKQRIDWGLSAQYIVENNMHQKAVMKNIISICNDNHIRLLLLKGFSLSKLYPQPLSRSSCDIDIFVFDDFDKTNVLLGADNFDFVHKHAAFDYRGVHVENHLTPLDTDTRFRKHVQRYLETTYCDVTQTEEGYYQLSPIGNLVYLVMHTMRHFDSNCSAQFKNIIDIAFFLKKNSTALQPQCCYATLSKLCIYQAFVYILYLAEWILNEDFSAYRKECVKERDIETLHTNLINYGLRNPIPAGFPYIDKKHRQDWQRYFRVVRIYHQLSGQRMLYSFKVLHYLLVVLKERH